MSNHMDKVYDIQQKTMDGLREEIATLRKEKAELRHGLELAIKATADNTITWLSVQDELKSVLAKVSGS